MLYLVAIILPPLAVLLCGKPFQAILNVFLTLLFWIPGMIHAILVVNGHYADKRADRIIHAVQHG
jgi:uncharacterized membrane protein YqaE (UPF0057 family)